MSFRSSSATVGKSGLCGRALRRYDILAIVGDYGVKRGGREDGGEAGELWKPCLNMWLGDELGVGAWLRVTSKSIGSWPKPLTTEPGAAGRNDLPIHTALFLIEPWRFTEKPPVVLRT